MHTRVYSTIYSIRYILHRELIIFMLYMTLCQTHARIFCFQFSKIQNFARFQVFVALTAPPICNCVMLHIYTIHILTNLFCQGHDSAPGLDMMLPKQQQRVWTGYRSCKAASYCWVRVPTLYVWRVDDLLGRVPLVPCFLDGNATSTIPHKYSSRQRDAFGCCCASVPMVLALPCGGEAMFTRSTPGPWTPATWLWNFGRPQPRMGGLSVAKTEKIRRKSRSDAAKRAWATKRSRKWPSHGIGIYIVYTLFIPHNNLWYILSDSKICLLSAIK